MKKSWIVFFMPFLMTSCQWVNSTLPNEQNLLEEELSKIDWFKVDTYPSFKQCDSILDVQAQRECFFSHLTAKLEQQLSNDTLKGKFNVNDTLQVLVTIKSDAAVTFQLKKPDSLTIYFLRIDSLLQHKNIQFTDIIPATKRGVPVNTEFVVPIVVKEH